MFKKVAFVMCSALFFSISGCSNSTPPETTAEETTQEPTTPAETETPLSDDAKEFLSVHELYAPQEFSHGDPTGTWRKVPTASSESVEDYAVEYASLFMDPADKNAIHWIINYTNKTTSMLKYESDDTLLVRTTEYVDKEEHDASILGKGTPLSETVISLDTGDILSSETIAPTEPEFSPEKVEIAVKTAALNGISEDLKITDVSLKDKVLYITVDMSNYDDSLVPIRDGALVTISSITDEILKLDDEYNDAYDRIELSFGSVGTAILTKYMIKSNAYGGRYFDFSDDVLR